jgi:hypothetical protein
MVTGIAAEIYNTGTGKLQPFGVLIFKISELHLGS